MFSVVIPLYNKEESILKTVDTVLNQNFKNFQLIIVDDGSTDNSLDRIRTINDDRLIIILQDNKGVSSARNTGIRAAKFDWIALLDADDLWDLHHLESFAATVENHPEIKVISSGYRVAKKEGVNLSETVVSKEGFYDFFEISLIHRFVVHTSSIAFKKSAFGNIWFNEQLSKGEDLNFWEQLAKRTPFYLLNDISSSYIDNAENKAVYKPHPVSKTHVFTIDSQKITDAKQRKYYINLILHSVFLVLEKQQTIPDALKIYWKHARFIGLKGFYLFAGILLNKRSRDKR